MKIISHIFLFFATVIPLIVPLVSCSEQQVPVVDDEEDDVYLNLIVSSNDRFGVAQSRSDEGEYEFKQSESANELINSLRIYVLNPDKQVGPNETVTGWKLEAKRYIPLGQMSVQGVVLYDDLIFNVQGNQWKRIYIFANTETFKGTGNPNNNLAVLFNRLDEIPFGQSFPVVELEKAVIERNENDALYGSNENIPMSEVFDVYITNDQKFQTLNTFITRTAAKFTFNFIMDAKYIGIANGLGVNIGIDCISDREYLLPNNTVYSPADKNPKTLTLGDRNILSYNVPQAAKTSKFYIFNSHKITEDDLEADLIRFSVDNVYLPETFYSPRNNEQQEYWVKVKMAVDGDGAETTGEWFRAKLPNLPDLPRNTHVIVNLSLNPEADELICEVKLAPYGVIDLKPFFGLDPDNFKPQD